MKMDFNLNRTYWIVRLGRTAVRPYTPHAIMLVCLLWLGVARAADFQVSASLDRSQVALNNQAVLSVTISGNDSNLPAPQLPGLADFQITSSGRSQNFTWVNGKASASVTYNFALTPLREGRFTIPSILVQSGGQKAETTPLTLEVVKGDASAVQGTARPEGGRPPAPEAQGPAAIFITGTVDKTSVYVGEPMTFTFRFYNRVRLLRQPNYQAPEMTGFWTENLPPQRNYSTQVRGVPYNVIELKTALFPSLPGKARIGPASLAVSIENFGTDPFGSEFFAQFFGRGEEKVLRTDPIAIMVKALPEPKPSSFNGAVGDYSVSAQVDKEKVPVGQPLTLSLTVSGRGNIKSVPDLALPPLTNFRTFDANASTTLETKEGQVTGSKVFKTVLIPTASGDLTIPAVPFAYFDSSARVYRTVHTRPIVVRATPAAGGSTSATPWGQTPASAGGLTPAAAPGIKLLSEDIRYIRTPNTLHSQGAPLYKRKWYVAMHIALLSLLGLGGLARLYHWLFLSNTALSRFRKARERALKEIRRTDGYVLAGDIKGAGKQLSEALQEFLGAKLGSEAKSLALKEIVERLKDRGLVVHTGEKIRNVWETLDLYQFAPAQVRPEEIQSAMETVGHVVEEVEKQIQWK
jgi:hypothetical protein